MIIINFRCNIHTQCLSAVELIDFNESREKSLIGIILIVSIEDKHVIGLNL